ncbi:MAG: 4a-hydroxytetrahydrobiopterin dehydratase [Desulfobacter sp.]|uniref:4a-hydroxytetrahydrobiopterin dehydratase n=1 Tax=uncultured Desulfobacter sp. TaxID=240139 RepID=UPI0029C950AC|nr:4a-hydroxytetrahydrobiopterin dehydratase [uncultured Desulfobacter sp.]MCW8800234.1 4a-hydroxytetrahydrobiopterin dehydratase [Desulfobacter sp.]
MEYLTKHKCVPCEKGGPVATADEIDAYKPQVPEWDIVDIKGSRTLRRVFRFKNFKQALAFVNQVGELAEAEYHHPTLILDWGRVEVLWTTHKIKGLHKNDFSMAAKTDVLFQS